MMQGEVNLNTLSNFIEEEEKILIPKYSISDLVLWLLDAQSDVPIFGRISFFKQIFLLYTEVLPDSIKKETLNPQFIGYYYGPYSFVVADVIEDMVVSGLVKISGRKNSKTEQFSLTDNGKEEAEKRIGLLPQEMMKSFISVLKERRITWDQLRNYGLLQYVYNVYPQYREKSRINRKITSSVWDVGRVG